MAKSLRSKIKKRWRTLKRGHIDNVVYKERQNKITSTLNAVLLGQEYREKDLPNGFLHPDNPESKFPQFKPAPIIDLRSTAIPGSGREWSGANRKNRTITQEVKIDNQIEEQSEHNQEQQEVVKERMNQEKVASSSQKVKKGRKSKLRKTIVF